MGISRKVFYQIKTHRETHHLLPLILVGKWSDSCPGIEQGRARELTHRAWQNGGEGAKLLAL